MSEPRPPRPAEDTDAAPECSDEPKLTADEWAYVEAMSTRNDP